MNLFFTYLLGPVAALLPKRWRNSIPMAGSVQWERAAAVSGVLESCAAVVGIGYWYMYVMNQVVGGAIELAIKDKPLPGLTDHQLSGAALMAFFLYPLTWILFYFFFEGAVRLCGAAFAESILGTLPLYLFDRILRIGRGGGETGPGETARENVKSIVESMPRTGGNGTLKEIPDELCFTTNATEEILEIRSSRKKEDWVAPKIVRVDDVYYRLESISLEKKVRPFRYQLKRLQAGVPGRNVILYKSQEAMVRE